VNDAVAKSKIIDNKCLVDYIGMCIKEVGALHVVTETELFLFHVL